MTTPVIIYHGDCRDGLAAAWVATKKLGECQFLPAKYGNPAPDLKGKDVYILDFSYSRDQIIKLKAENKSLLVIDHHKTAAKALDGLDYCIFDMERSGAGLSWDHFFPGENRPWFIDYIEDRDLWRFKLSHSKAVNAGLETVSREVSAFDGIGGLGEVKDYGYTILTYNELIIESILKNSRVIHFCDRNVLAVNSQVLISELGDKLCADNAFSVVWYVNSQGKFVYSLRSNEAGYDVSDIAKKFGGGGHKHASGFTLDSPLPGIMLKDPQKNRS